MTRFLVLSLAASAALLSGCVTGRGAPSQPPQMAPPASADTLPPMMPVEELGASDVRRPITGSCGMEALQEYVGRPRTSVAASVLPDNYRVLGPRSVVTMDYQQDRLTVRIDARDRIESISCG